MRLQTIAVLPLLALMLIPVQAQKLVDWDLFNGSQPGQHVTWLADPNGGFCGLPVEMGDYDNDGFLDYAVAALLADSGPSGGRQDAGEIYVFKGNGTVGGSIDLQNPPPGQPLLTIMGAAAFDYTGTEIYSADYTGDGIVDLIVGVAGRNPSGRTNAGSVYLVPGGPQFTGVLDLSSPPAWVTWIKGIDASDRLGTWVEAGDINGDNAVDLIMSADDGDGLTNSAATLDRGEVYVIWGGQSLPSVVDLASPPAGLQMLTVYGEDNTDQLGSCLHAADLDNDGKDELIASAALNRAVAANTGAGFAGGDGPSNGRSNAGDTYVIWGSASLPAVIDLSNPAPMLAANTLSIIYGADAGDVLGEEITSGNFDGDQYLDLCLGALTADGQGNAHSNAGDAVVVYGGPALRGQVLDMDLTPAGTTTLYGAATGDIGADTLSACDVNKDGLDDLLFAMPNSDPFRPGAGNINNAGAVLVLYGGPVRWPVTLAAASMPTDTDFPSRTVIGADSGDLTGYSMECADFDGDGFAEVFPNAMRGDGFNNSVNNAGEIYIVSGQRFSRGIITLQDAPVNGNLVRFNIVAEPGLQWLAAFAGAASPSQVIPGAGSVFLAPDIIFQLSISGTTPFFFNLVGTLAPDGRGQYSVFLPLLPALAGTRLYTAFVSYDPVAAQFGTISGTTSFLIQ